MRFVVISDTHSKHQAIKLPKGDVLIHAGDFSMRGTKEESIDFLQWFSKQKFRYKLFIAGNHDFFFENASEQEINGLIPADIIYLRDSGTTIQDISIWGSPITPWFFNWAFNRKRGEPIRRHWDLIPTTANIVITHGPVHGFLDVISNEQHVGCQDLLRKILLIKPRVHICGHIHESYGSLKRSGIFFMNASLVNEKYELMHRPIVFDW